MDMTFMKFSENLSEHFLEALLKPYFLIAIIVSMVWINRYLWSVYTPGVLLKVKWECGSYHTHQIFIFG
jgi:hypothetical protein